MRNFFFGLGVIAAALVGAITVGTVVVVRNGAGLDAESKAIVNDYVVNIAGHWDSDALWQRATPRFQTTTSREEMRAFFTAAQGALGSLIALRDTRGGVTMAFFNSSKSISATYIARGAFEKGDADLQIAMLKVGPNWLIEGFHIASPELMKNLIRVRS